MINLFALLACANPPQELLQAPDLPVVEDLHITAPGTALVGEMVAVEIRYTMPGACWSSATEVTEEQPNQYLLSINHSRREGDCPATPTREMSALEWQADEAGAWSITVKIDEVRRWKQDFEVKPASEVR